MTVNINPNRINVTPGRTGRSDERKRQEASDGSEFIIPARAHVNVVPEPESLHTLIRSAISSMRRGVFWDRGTILNILA